jgi:hypothetical protein
MVDYSVSLERLEKVVADLQATLTELRRATPPRGPSPGAKARFEGLVREWKSFESPSSSVAKLAMHPAYQRIIGMGESAVPLLLAELEREPDHWFWALHSITGADPVPEQSRGNLNQMAEAWLEWGRQQGYSW